MGAFDLVKTAVYDKEGGPQNSKTKRVTEGRKGQSKLKKDWVNIAGI